MYTTRHALATPPAPRDHRPGPHTLPSLSLHPSLSVFFASFLALPTNNKRAPHWQQRNSVAAQLLLAAAAAVVVVLLLGCVSPRTHDESRVIFGVQTLTTWMGCRATRSSPEGPLARTLHR